MKNLLIVFLMVFSLTSQAQDNETKYRKALIEHNKKVIEYFYKALEHKDYNLLQGIFDLNGKATYSEMASRESVAGRENIIAQFKSLLDTFSKSKYSTMIKVSDDGTLVTAKVKGKLEKPDGTKVQNNYTATFKLKDGKIVEYVEYGSSQNPT